MQEKDHLIFISYTTLDQNRVIPFYDRLCATGFNVWMDCKKIKPGQNWDFEIKRAFNRASIVILFISKNSEQKRGYIQREVKLALKNLEEKLPDDIYLIPVLLDKDIERPEHLAHLQMTPGYDSEGAKAIEDAVQYQLERYGVAIKKLQEEEHVSWGSTTIKENWEGLPGYEASIETLELKSNKYKNIEQASHIINGELYSSLLSCRMAKLEQDTSFFSYAQEDFQRTDTLDIILNKLSFRGRLMSASYTRHYYPCGAAHGSYAISTYNFCMSPLFRIETVKWLFQEPAKALPIVRERVRTHLMHLLYADTESKPDEWVTSGTEEWSHLENYSFLDEGLEFNFSSYQVAPFAAGLPIITVPYDEIKELFKETVKQLLSIY